MGPYNECRLGSVRPFQISAHVMKPGNGYIHAAFEANFTRGLERGAQLVVYENGETIVDLSGITLPEDDGRRAYDGDSISMIWSSGKNLEAIAMCILVDQGLLKYEEKVCTYWPEFAKNGKEDILVEDVLRHDSGLFGFCREIRYDESFKAIGEVIANSAKLSEGRVYHGYSRGLILNQICVRCDAKKRTIAQLLQEELFTKIGFPDDFILGKGSEEVLKRVHPYTKNSGLWNMSQVMCPSMMGCNLPWTSTSPEERRLYRNMMKNLASIKKSLLFENQLAFNPDLEQDFAADPQNEIEVPSAWFLTTARLLAKCGALMSQGGIIDGVRILKQETVEEALSSPTCKRELNYQNTLLFTRGGFAVMGVFAEVEMTGNEYYGWCGANGSIFAFQYKGGKPGGCAMAYNCTAGYKATPYDIRGAEILRQLGLDLSQFDGPSNFLIESKPTDI